MRKAFTVAFVMSSWRWMSSTVCDPRQKQFNSRFVFQKANRWFRRWAFLLGIRQFLAVLDWFNSSGLPDGFFSRLAVTAFLAGSSAVQTASYW